MPINRALFSNGKKYLKKNAFVEWTYEWAYEFSLDEMRENKKVTRTKNSFCFTQELILDYIGILIFFLFSWCK